MPVLVGISGTKLENRQIELLQKYRPVGILLFGENCESEEQVKSLTASLKKMGFIIAVDLEGKSINRFKKFYPLDKDACDFKNASLEEIYDYHYNIARYAKNLGIDIILGPVSDVCGDTSLFMFKRCFSDDPRRVAECVGVVVKAYQDAGIYSVIKHLPGHGKAIDSHKFLPTVYASEQELKKCDILASEIVIKNLKAQKKPLPGAMVSHVIYNAFDENFPASLSKIIIKKVIREQIGIGKGLIFSDDLRMQAIDKFMERSKKLESENSKQDNNILLALNGFLQAGGDIAIFNCIENLDEKKLAKILKKTKIMWKILKVIRLK